LRSEIDNALNSAFKNVYTMFLTNEQAENTALSNISCQQKGPLLTHGPFSRRAICCRLAGRPAGWLNAIVSVCQIGVSGEGCSSSRQATLDASLSIFPACRGSERALHVEVLASSSADDCEQSPDAEHQQHVFDSERPATRDWKCLNAI